MALGYLVVAMLAAASAIFALQNGTPTPVRFIAWTVDGVPLAGLVLAALAGGLLITGLPLMLQRWRLRTRLRAAERRVAEMEALASRFDLGVRATGIEPQPPASAVRHRSASPQLPQAM